MTIMKLKIKIFVLKLLKDNSDQWQDYYQHLNMELFFEEIGREHEDKEYQQRAKGNYK